MTVGQTHQLGKIVGPSDAKVVWHSRNGNVAKVENGKITALSPGTTVIWIEVSKFEIIETAAFTLTVVNPPASGVTITNKNQNTITVDDVRTYSATVTPSNADNKAVKWISTKDYVASINPNTGKLTALSPGTTIIRAVSVGNPAKYDEFTLTVNRHPDPFHVTNIENIRITNIDLGEFDGGTIVATKSYLSNDWYFTGYPTQSEPETYVVNSYLIDTLNNIEYNYSKHLFPDIQATRQESNFHRAKRDVDVLVSRDLIEFGSTEYYGLWAYNGNKYSELSEKIDRTLATITQAYGVYVSLVSIYSSYLIGNTKNLSANQYKTAVDEMHLVDTSLSNTSYTNKTYFSAEQINTSLNYKYPPFKSESTVTRVTLTKSKTYSRVYTDNIYGKWVMPSDDIKNLTPQQIKNKYGLEKLPTKVCDVKIPAGTTMDIGIAAPIDTWNVNGGGVQYYIRYSGNIPESWFVNSRALK